MSKGLSIENRKPPLWRQILRTNFVSWEKLANHLELSADDRAQIDPKSSFALNLPLRIANKIEKQNLQDPLLTQFLPTIAERAVTPDFVQDPTADRSFCKTTKLLQKYPGRALLVCTSACAMHCRYCFRQNFDYQPQSSFDQEIDLIAGDPTLREIILSGGDPLSLSNEILEALLRRLDAIPHLRRLRFHTRFPIGIPERIDEGFLHLLEITSKQIWFVIHANHPRELDGDVLAALTKIRKLGIVVMNQSVLLRGVNDDAKTLQELSEKLVDNGIVPYYLHQLDRVAGAEHFNVPEAKGKRLVSEIRKKLSGYAIPTYVAEIVGEDSKTPY